MAFDYNLFNDFSESFTAPLPSLPGIEDVAANEALEMAAIGFKPQPVIAPPSPLDKSAVGLPSWFTPLPAVKRSSAYRRNQQSGRTMPLNEAKSLADVNILQVEGSPSVELFLGANDNATVTITRQSKYWEFFADEDKATIWGLADEMFQAYQAHSNGHYSLRALERMNHPYGYGEGKIKSGQNVRRRVPRRHGGQSIGHVSGIRGSVPTMSVINRQSGLLMASWQKGREELENGYVLKFFNTAKTPTGFPYPFALAAGTSRMQPHGPWTQVATSYIRRLNSAHQRAVRRARHAALALEMAGDLNLEDY